MTLIKPSNGNSSHVLGEADQAAEIPGLIVQSGVQPFKIYCHRKDIFSKNFFEKYSYVCKIGI